MMSEQKRIDSYRVKRIEALRRGDKAVAEKYAEAAFWAKEAAKERRTMDALKPT